MIEEIVTWNKLSTVETAARVLVETDRLGLSKDHHKVTVGEPGLGGGVIDVLREIGVRVRGYNGGATPLRVEKFRNCRAESFWGLWRRLERGEIALPPDMKLTDELCSMRWSIGLHGRIQIESKDDLRARIGWSPDRAGAVAMAFRPSAPRWFLGAFELGAALRCTVTEGPEAARRRGVFPRRPAKRPDLGTFQQSYGQHLAAAPSDPASQQLVGLPGGERGAASHKSGRRLSSPW